MIFTIHAQSNANSLCQGNLFLPFDLACIEEEPKETYTSPVATLIKKKPRKMRRHVSCFLSNGCERPPQAPAHRQQQTHNLKKTQHSV